MFGRGKFGKFALFEHKNFGGLIDYSKGYWMILVWRITNGLLNFPPAKLSYYIVLL